MAASCSKTFRMKILKGLIQNCNSKKLGSLRLSPSVFFCKKLHTSSSIMTHTAASKYGIEKDKAKMRTVPLESHLETSLINDDYFQLKNLLTLRSLFEARVHLGHNSGLRHESMTPFLFGERLGQDIIDLEQTLLRLQEALNICAHIVYRGGMVLFLSRHQQILPWVERTAKEVGEYSHCRVWRRGTFTNASRIFNTLPIYPELCIFITTQDTVFEQHRAVIESSKLLIPSIGIVDSNCDANHITYPIPGNDDTPDSLHLYLKLFHTAILRAKEKRKVDGLEQ